MFLNFFKSLFPKECVFPNNSSWMLNDDLSVNKSNVKSCKEFIALRNTKQSKVWHKEGNALNHTFLVCEEMYKIINKELIHISDYDKRVLMLASLCHDLGKSTTTYYDEKDKDWHCKNHGTEGEKITRMLLFQEKDYWLREEVCWLVRNHMVFHHFLDKDKEKQKQELIKLSNGHSTIEKLLWLNVADSRGSKNSENTKLSIDYKIFKIKELAKYNGCYHKKIKNNLKREEFNVYFLIGPPGCGKDTYISKFLRFTNTISRDDIREELFDGNVEGRKLYLSKENENLVTNIVNMSIRKYTENKEKFIINQTNMKKKYREELLNEIRKYGNPKITYIYVEAPSIEECKKRRGNGKWDEIVDRMWNNFEFPDYNECDKLIFYKQLR